MQISTKGNSNMVRVSRVSSYPGFELTGLWYIENLTFEITMKRWRIATK